GAVLGFHLMWPIVVSESGDFFEGYSRANNYVYERPWTVGFLTVFIFTASCVTYLLLRLVVLLGLKLAHVALGAGMNLVTASNLATVGKLDALWWMPDWSNLTLLPLIGDVPIGGVFGGSAFMWDGFIAWLIGVAVCVVVALIPAFLLSLYFCASTQMYFVLRR